MRLIPSIIFSLITYFMAGFQLSAIKFFIYLLTIFLGTIFGSSVCFFVASCIPIFGEKKIESFFSKRIFLFSGFIDCCSISFCCYDGF